MSSFIDLGCLDQILKWEVENTPFRPTRSTKPSAYRTSLKLKGTIKTSRDQRVVAY